MQLNFFLVLVVHTVVYSIVFFSIFDLYFTTPVVDGVRPVEISTQPLARRLVLFIADGLRADKFFEVDQSGKSRAPYLREQMLHDAVWGVSHSQPPTESRPAHVAILGGFFEDMSAIKVLWKRNPVEFDTVLNRSKETWAWGAPDVLPFFNQGSAASHVHIYSHNYNQRPLFQLDEWVFTKVEKFLRRAKYDEDLQKSVHNDKIIFFLHLAGIDSNGHRYGSNSLQYLQNIPVVDRGVRKMVDLFEDFYENDRKTAFIFTADHGQTDGGSHGGGDPVETLVPVVAWGAGVRNPDEDEDSPGKIPLLNYKEIIQTKKWGLDPNRRVDMSQVDLAPLMSSLISVPFPVNSLGSLPLPYLSCDLPTMADLSRIHAMQMLEQLIAKYRHLQKRSFHLLSSLFGGLDDFALSRKNMEIVDYIKKGKYHKALQKTNQLFHHSKKQLLDYHISHRPFIYFSVLVSLFGCLLLAIVFITKDHSTHRSKIFLQTTYTRDETKVTSNMMRRFLVGLSIVFIIILLYYKSPWMEYAYYFIPVIVWFIVSSYSHVLISMVEEVFRDRTSKQQLGKMVLVTFLWIWILMMCLFYRAFVTIGLLTLSVMPYLLLKRNCWTQNIVWSCLCISMAVFPLLPEVIRKDLKGRKDLVLLAGVLGTVLVLCCNCISRNDRQKRGNTKLESLKRAIGLAQMLLPAISAIVVYFTTSSVFLHDSGKHILWISCVAPALGSRNVVKRLTVILSFQLTAYILFSLTYDALFCVNLAALMMAWLKMEIDVGNANSQMMVVSRDSKFEWNDKSRLKPFTLRSITNTFVFHFFLTVGFFGIFSMEAVNDLNIRRLPFLPISNPTLLVITLTYKVKDAGSWAEIGISVARLGIIVVLPLAASTLMLLCKIYASLNLLDFLPLNKVV